MIAKKKFKIRVGDQVEVIAGKEKGKQGKITKIHAKADRVLVEGMNLVTKHMKASQQNPQGAVVKKEGSIHISNVMLLDPKTNKPTRVGMQKSEAGKWVRVAKKSGTVLAVANK